MDRAGKASMRDQGRGKAAPWNAIQGYQTRILAGVDQPSRAAFAWTCMRKMNGLWNVFRIAKAKSAGDYIP